MKVIYILLTLGVWAFPSQGCVSSMDCNLNGDCFHSKCVCDIGWMGLDCGELLHHYDEDCTPSSPHYAHWRTKIQLFALKNSYLTRFRGA